jgi:hypothetical protein
MAFSRLFRTCVVRSGIGLPSREIDVCKGVWDPGAGSIICFLKWNGVYF